MKQRKRRYQEIAYERSLWPRGMPTYRVAVVVGPSDDGKVRLVFHVPHPLLVTVVMDRLQGTLFEGYCLREEYCQSMLNGKCYKACVTEIRGADTLRLSVKEWPMMIKSMMERRFRVQVTCFDNYERFLNA